MCGRGGRVCAWIGAKQAARGGAKFSTTSSHDGETGSDDDLLPGLANMLINGVSSEGLRR